MSRKFITSILIAAVTVTGISLSAAPAKAGNDDLAKILFGATALIIIGKAIESNNKAEAASRHKQKVTPPRPSIRRKALPARCLRVHDTWDGRVRMLGQRCLEKRYTHVNQLPRQCKTRVRTYDGPRQGYQMRCLRNKGFYLASK